MIAVLSARRSTPCAWASRWARGFAALRSHANRNYPYGAIADRHLATALVARPVVRLDVEAP